MQAFKGLFHEIKLPNKKACKVNWQWLVMNCSLFVTKLKQQKGHCQKGISIGIGNKTTISLTLYSMAEMRCRNTCFLLPGCISHKSFLSSKVSLTVWTTAARACFSTICLSLPQSHLSSPGLWWGPRTRLLRNVAPRKWWEPSPTPCSLAPFKENFLPNVSMVASTLSLALPVQIFALEKVLSIDTYWCWLMVVIKVGH